MQNKRIEQSNLPLCIFLFWVRVYINDYSMTLIDFVD